MYSYPSYDNLQLVFKNCSYTPCKSQFKNGKICKKKKKTLFSHYEKSFPVLFHYLISICYSYPFDSYAKKEHTTNIWYFLNVNC